MSMNKNTHQADSGFTLLTAIWLLLIIATIALSLYASALTLRQGEQPEIEAAQLDQVALSAVQIFLRSRLLDESGNLSLAGSMTVDGEPVSYRARVETGKVNINRASTALLSAAFASKGIEQIRAEALAYEIADWRDQDNETASPSGGDERAPYIATGLTYDPRNGPFETVGELMFLPSITEELFDCTRNLFTVYSLQSDVNLAFADDDVLNIFRFAWDNVWAGFTWPDPDDPTVISNMREASSDIAGQAMTIRIRIGALGANTRDVTVRFKSSTDYSFAILAVRNQPTTAPPASCS